MERLDLTGRNDIPVREEVIAELVTLSRRAGLDIDVAIAVGGPGDFTKFTACPGRPQGARVA